MLPYYRYILGPRSIMDNMPVFGTGVPGSNPGEGIDFNNITEILKEGT